MNMVENFMEGGSIHAPRKCPVVQEKGESSIKQTHFD